MPTQHPALRQLFTDYRSLTADDLPVFEIVLIGGMVEAIVGFANAPSVTDRQCADLFGLIPTAAAITRGPDAPPSPAWASNEVDGLGNLRDAIITAAPTVASSPDNVMLRLVPILRQQLTQDAGDATTQIRMAFLRTMVELARPADHGIADDDLHRVLVDTIHRHEQSALSQ